MNFIHLVGANGWSALLMGAGRVGFMSTSFYSLMFIHDFGCCLLEQLVIYHLAGRGGNNQIDRTLPLHMPIPSI